MGSGGWMGTGVVLAEMLPPSVRAGVLEWASKAAMGVKAVCMAAASWVCFFLSDWLEAKRTTKKAKSRVMKSA